MLKLLSQIYLVADVILEMIERAVEDVRVEAKTGIDQRGILAANLGAKYALEDLRDSLIQYRFNAALQRRQESE